MKNNFYKQDNYYYDNTGRNNRYYIKEGKIQEQWGIVGEWEDSQTFDLTPPIEECISNIINNRIKEENDFNEAMYAELIDFENKRVEKRDSWKRELKGLINVKRLWEEFENEYDTWDIEDIVEIVVTDKKRPNYPNHECAYIKGEEKYFLFMKVKPDYGIKFIDHLYVWQQTGYLGDDYSGYLLYPLKNGKYLKISYSC